jgi:hypothetical protein
MRIPLPLLRQIVENPDEEIHEYTTYKGNVVVATKAKWEDGSHVVCFDFVYNPDD